MELLIIVGGYIAVLAVTARVWEARPALRCLPIVYGIFIGVTLQYSKSGLDMWKILDGVAFGVFIGLTGIFAIWVEERYGGD